LAAPITKLIVNLNYLAHYFHSHTPLN